MRNKKLSIITINRNNAKGLHKTMESVFSQTYRDIEYIIIDGASTDNSIEVIREMSDTLNDGMSRDKSLNDGMVFKWISEPDTGIYNAMNKGLRMSHGEYTLMLNSGDYLVDEHVIERILPELDGTDIVQGNNIEERNGVMFRNRGYGRSDIDIADVMKGHFLHQASFCRRDLFDRYGYFDETYRSSADSKFFMVCLGRHDATFRYMDIDVTNYDLSGISADTSDKWRKCRREELRRIIEEVFSERIYLFIRENDKKIRLYNELHAHKWSWYFTMMIARINSRLYKR